MLSSLKVDAIKLDALFLNIQASNQSGIRILESVVNMAKQIGLPIIVEGIENEKQKNFLEDLGVKDSKKMTDEKILEVVPEIIKLPSVFTPNPTLNEAIALSY